MIIGFSGRMRNGKSCLASVCVEHGFQHASFAVPLKRLSMEILSLDELEFNDMKNSNSPYQVQFDDKLCETISTKANIPIEHVIKIAEGKKTENIRHFLQFVGTDIIRSYDTDWHVNRTLEMLKDDVNYAIDDVRFPNEHKAIIKRGGDVWFISRPYIEKLSNHFSETSIKWQDCLNRVIVNDRTEAYFRFSWANFLENYAISCKARDNKLEQMLSNPDLEYDDECESLLISKSFLEYTPVTELEGHKVVSSKLNDGVLFLELENGSIEAVSNALRIEDCKSYINP